MKTHQSYLKIAFILFITAFISCSKKEDTTPIVTTHLPPLATDKPKGIYVANKLDDSLNLFVYNDTNVDGVFLRFKWETIEPQPNVYNWSVLDLELNKAVTNRKYISIGLVAGRYTPDWVYQQNDDSVNLTIIPHWGSGDCNNMNIPVFWHSNYLNQFQQLITNFAAHVKSNSDWYNNISCIKLTGLNIATEELRVPAEDSVTNGSCFTSNCPEIWKVRGYKPSITINTFRTLQNWFHSAFPDKVLSLPVIDQGHDFPAVDENGQVTTSPEAVTDSCVYAGLTLGAQNFSVQFNALSATAGTLAIVETAAGLGAIGAYQLDELIFGDPPCLTNGTSCDDTEFRKAIDNGIAHKASFIEIHENDVEAFPNAVAYGHQKLN